MKNFIKENWFKIIIIITLVIVAILFILQNLYFFIYQEGGNIIRCNRITGQCVRVFGFLSLPKLPSLNK